MSEKPKVGLPATGYLVTGEQVQRAREYARVVAAAHGLEVDEASFDEAERYAAETIEWTEPHFRYDPDPGAGFGSPPRASLWSRLRAWAGRRGR